MTLIHINFFWAFGELSHQVGKDLSFHRGARHVFDIESSQNRTPLSDSPGEVGTSKYGLKRQLGQDDHGMGLKVVQKFACCMDHRQYGLF